MGYDPARIADLTPRQIVAFIISRNRAEYENWRNAGLISITLRRLHGDKHADFDKLFPPWNNRSKTVEERKAINMKNAKVIAARRRKVQEARLKELKRGR